MSNFDEVKSFIDVLQGEMSNNQILTAGLVLLLQEIGNKRSYIAAQDFCDDIERHLFTWTLDFDKANRNYADNLKNRIVGEFKN